MSKIQNYPFKLLKRVALTILMCHNLMTQYVHVFLSCKEKCKTCAAITVGLSVCLSFPVRSVLSIRLSAWHQVLEMYPEFYDYFWSNLEITFNLRDVRCQLTFSKHIHYPPLSLRRTDSDVHNTHMEEDGSMIDGC